MKEVDQELAHLLELQGFQTTKAIASTMGVAERTVRRHLDRMIKQRMIKVVAIPNPVLCGFKAWSKIGIRVDRGCLNRVARMSVEHPAVYFAAYSLGRFDIIIAVHFDTIAKLASFVNSELVGTKGVVNSEIWMLASPRKYYGFSWPAPDIAKLNAMRGHYHEVVVDNEDCNMDGINQDIIAVLREDGFARPAAIKSKLGLGESLIRKRIRYMLDNNVYRREVVLSPQLLENETWATVGITTNGQDAHEVIDSVLKYPSVYLASVSLGKFNVVIATRFRNMDLLNQFVTVGLPSIEGISSTETFVHTKPLKYHNIPMAYPHANEWGFGVSNHIEKER